MNGKMISFARYWAKRYVREKHPYGLDEEDVENRILESLYKYSRGNPSICDDAQRSKNGKADAPQWMKDALSEALNAVLNEGRRNLRALYPWQVRNAESHLEAKAYINLAHDMTRLRIRQNIREHDRRCVRRALAMLSPEDRQLADEFMALGSWRKVAERRRMAWGTFEYRPLAGFIARFKDAWKKVC